MELGMIGMGRVGSNMARRLLKGGHNITAWDPAKDYEQILEQSDPKHIKTVIDIG